MDYDVELIDKWVAPKEDGAPILCMPNIPLPLHSLAPRTINPTKWETTRKRCYMKSEYTCQASGDYLGHGKCQAHELYSINWGKCEASFERCVCLEKNLHTVFIHSGRALSLYTQGYPYVTKDLMIRTMRKGFRLISEYNKAHPKNKELRVSATFIDWAKEPSLTKEVNALIDYYNIKFYDFNWSCFNKKNWGKWKLLYNGKEYNTKFQNQQDWEQHFNSVKQNSVEAMKDSYLKTLDDLMKEVNE